MTEVLSRKSEGVPSQSLTGKEQGNATAQCVCDKKKVSLGESAGGLSILPGQESALVVKWDPAGPGQIKKREFPIDTRLKIIGSQYGFSTLQRYDRGVWMNELTTPGAIFIEGRVV